MSDKNEPNVDYRWQEKARPPETRTTAMGKTLPDAKIELRRACCCSSCAQVREAAQFVHDNNQRAIGAATLCATLALVCTGPTALPEERPKIVTLCGSSRFIEHMAILAWELEKEGAIVLSLHLLPAAYPSLVADHQAEAEGVADKMDALHLRKIDLCDQVMIVNVDGYIGDSTRREIAYARSIGKPVSCLVEHAAPEVES